MYLSFDLIITFDNLMQVLVERAEEQLRALALLQEIWGIQPPWAPALMCTDTHTHLHIIKYNENESLFH